MPSYDHIALLDDTDPFQLICTSGTTGPAKAVVQHCGLFEPNVRDLIATYELTEKDRTLLINRLFHVNALVTNFFPMVLLGGTTVLCSSKPEDILKTISAKKITYSSMIPPMLLMLLKYQSNNNSKPKLQKRTETLRFIIVGADILTVSTHKLFSDTFGIKILPGWGMTETFCWGTGTAVNGPNYWGSIGRGLPHMELKIVDPENNWEEVCDNQFGRLIVRGDNVFKNYFRNPEATDKSFAPSERWSNGWFDTGDTCRMIYKSGPVFFGGRASADSWKVRGEFVDAPKIDEYLLKFPLVEDAMAVSVIIGGETETAACVVLKKHREIPDKMLTDGVLKYCELGRIDGSLEKHIKIKKIFSVESIELGDTGKRSRKKMTELAQKIYDEKINGGIYETVGT